MSNPPPPPNPGYGQPPYSGPIGSQVYVQPGPSNGLGLAGFITSLVGLVLCLGLLSPVGLLLSFFAVFKKPRGFALAGLILGLIGTVMLVVVTAGIVLTAVGIGKVGQRVVQEIETRQTARDAYEVIQAHRAQSENTLPAAEFGTALIDGKLDAWQTQLRYVPTADMSSYSIESAGPDKAFDTPDDITMTETDLEAWEMPTTMPGVEGFGNFEIPVDAGGATKIGTH